MPPFSGSQELKSGFFGSGSINRHDRWLLQRLLKSLVVTANIVNASPHTRASRWNESAAKRDSKNNCKSPAIKIASAGSPQSSQKRNVWQPRIQPSTTSQKAGWRF